MKTKRKGRLWLAAVIQVALCLWLWVMIELPLSGREWLHAIMAFCFWSLVNYNVVVKKLRLSASQKRSLVVGIRGWCALMILLYLKISGKSRVVR